MGFTLCFHDLGNVVRLLSYIEILIEMTHILLPFAMGHQDGERSTVLQMFLHTLLVLVAMILNSAVDKRNWRRCMVWLVIKVCTTLLCCIDIFEIIMNNRNNTNESTVAVKFFNVIVSTAFIYIVFCFIEELKGEERILPLGLVGVNNNAAQAAFSTFHQSVAPNPNCPENYDGPFHQIEFKPEISSSGGSTPPPSYRVAVGGTGLDQNTNTAVSE